MKTNVTEIIFILDRSGSMAGLESDTIGGYNSLLAKQQHEPGEAYVTTVLFDDCYEILHNRVNIKDIVPITGEDYFVRGSTALLDAVGKTIQMIGNAQKYTVPSRRADKVMMVITTDGMENASREYDYGMIKQMIDRQKTRFGWEFIFLGANIDAVGTAGRMGIDPGRAANYCADSESTRLNYKIVSEAIHCIRTNNELKDDWKASIDKNYASKAGRSKKKQ